METMIVACDHFRLSERTGENPYYKGFPDSPFRIVLGFWETGEQSDVD